MSLWHLSRAHELRMTSFRHALPSIFLVHEKAAGAFVVRIPSFRRVHEKAVLFPLPRLQALSVFFLGSSSGRRHPPTRQTRRKKDLFGMPYHNTTKRKVITQPNARFDSITQPNARFDRRASPQAPLENSKI